MEQGDGLVAELLRRSKVVKHEQQSMGYLNASILAEHYEAKWRKDAVALAEALARVAVLEAALRELDDEVWSSH